MSSFKQQLQERELQRLKDRPRVILKWATGCGKSKMTIDLINNKIENGNLKILFVVAERAHIQNWEDEFSKWHLRRDKVATYICCYASFHKYTNISFDLVVFDEAHHLFSPKRWAALEEMKENGNIHDVYLLSATLSRDKQDRIEELLSTFTTSTVTLKDAIKENVLPDPKVYVVEMELNNFQTNQEIKIGKIANPPMVNWEDRAKYIYSKKPCIIRCTEAQKYIYYTNTMEYWKQRYQRSHNQFQHNMWVNTGSLRKRYLGELKTAAVYNFLQKIRHKRYVCFCTSINQADMLSSTHTISSKKGANRNQYIINSFNNKYINSIYAVGMITEGMNLTDIQIGVIVQLDGKERLFIQKFGRSLRAQDPITFIFYYKGTQDEKYLKNALENIDSKYVKFINTSQLKDLKL
jgi:superfamily II DNA or RNA helicase